MKERERRVAAEGGSLGAYDGLYQGEATAASRQWWRWHDRCSVQAVQYVEGIIRDAAFFLQEIQRYKNSLASWLQ